MKEKWIIVTGAGSGIGKEIVKECGRRAIQLLLVILTMEL